MSKTLQYVLAGIIVALAVIAAVTSFVRAARGQKTTLTACTSCKLKDICMKKVARLSRILMINCPRLFRI